MQCLDYSKSGTQSYLPTGIYPECIITQTRCPPNVLLPKAVITKCHISQNRVISPEGVHPKCLPPKILYTKRLIPQTVPPKYFISETHIPQMWYSPKSNVQSDVPPKNIFITWISDITWNEVCTENNGNFFISWVWRVLLSIFFYFVGIHTPEVWQNVQLYSLFTLSVAAAKVRRVFMSSAIFVC